MWRPLGVVWLLLWAGWAAASSWELIKHDRERDIRIWTRDLPGEDFPAFYASTTVEAKLSTVVAVLLDVPAMPEWAYRVQSARLLKQRDERENWIYTVNRMPYPFRERDVVLHNRYRQDPKTRLITIETEAVPGWLKPVPGRVRIPRMHSRWLLTPLGRGRVQVVWTGSGELGGWVPAWATAMGLPDGPHFTLRNLRRMIQRSKYQDKGFSFVREPNI